MPPVANDSGVDASDPNAPDADGPDADVTDPDPDDDGGEPTAATYKIDLLFVVDNSNSMREEQAALREQFPMLISRLLAHGVRRRENESRVRRYSFGVVRPTWAHGGYGIDGCVGLGDDGLLHDPRAPRSSLQRCDLARFPLYLAAASMPLARNRPELHSTLSLRCASSSSSELLKAVGRSMPAASLPGRYERLGERSIRAAPKAFLRHGGDYVSVLAIGSDRRGRLLEQRTSPLFRSFRPAIREPARPTRVLLRRPLARAQRALRREPLRQRFA